MSVEMLRPVQRSLWEAFDPEPQPEATLPAGAWELALAVERRLADGCAIPDNRTLTRLAEIHFGGTRGAGRYTPRDAYDALEAGLNRFLLARGRALLEEPRRALDELRGLCARLPTQTDRTHEQDELQQFSTPAPLALVALHALAVEPGECVLEPSAGVGNLAVLARLAGATVHVNEIAPRRAAFLKALGFDPTAVDAEFLNDLLPAHVRPTAVLMNPPFSSTGGRVTAHRSAFGARHVSQALARLADGGRLVAIVGEGLALDRPGARDWWEDVTARFSVRADLGLPASAFAKQGTQFRTRLLVIDKTGPTRGASFAERVRSIRFGDVATLEDALAAVTPLRALRGVRDTQAAVPAANAEPYTATAGTVAPPPAAAPTPARPAPAEELPGDGTFVRYVPSQLGVAGLAEHPAEIVEAASMAAVELPPLTYRGALPESVLRDGRLSAVALESVLYAGQRHAQTLPDGRRAGYFVGDGTGVGKGRIVAGILLDNWCQGRRRAAWVSVSQDLMQDAIRDRDDVGASEIPLVRINDFPADGDIALAEGIVFTTYASLIARARGERTQTRREQLERWLGPDAVIVFDEAHRAKNALAAGRGEPTQTGQAVIDLQKNLPGARVTYVSATGASDVRHMAYMTRLGLWGPGTAFPRGFEQFLVEISGGGIGAMEMVARDLKALGMYNSRSLSFRGVEYREAAHVLTPEQRRIYDTAARAWQVVLRNVERAIEVTNGDARARASAMSAFWSAQQRFFNQLLVALKVPACIAEAERALAAGCSVIIGLINTGESRTAEKVARALAEGNDLDDLDFTPREVIASLVERCFPLTLYQEQTDEATGKTIRVPVLDRDGNPVTSREAQEMKDGLLDELSGLTLPENPLDQIVNHFGEDRVAELTGRKRRLIRDPRTGAVEYRTRAVRGVAMDRVNLNEMRLFQAGSKRVAILSDAASTGISLHASRRAGNQQRRVHITLQLGWSADRQMQTFGRSHRTDQASAPEYVLLSTDAGGERRFSSTIARRLAGLGALSKGQRDAVGAGDLARFNFETQEGEAALAALYRRMLAGEEMAGLDDPRGVLVDMGLMPEDGTLATRDLHDVPRFLNRLLALDLARQNAVFAAFVTLFDETIARAKASGTFDEGVSDVKGLAIRLAQEPSVVHCDVTTGARTFHYVLHVDRKTEAVTWEGVCARHALALAAGGRRGELAGFYEQRTSGRIVYAEPGPDRTDARSGEVHGTMAVSVPKGWREALVRAEEFLGWNASWGRIEPADAEASWRERHGRVPKVETREMHLVGGAILPLWDRFRAARATRLRVVRATTDQGRRVVGVQVPRADLAATLRALGVTRTLRSAGGVFRAVLQERETVALVAGLELRRVSVHGEPRLELRTTGAESYAELRALGLLKERIDWRQRFFVPTEEGAGVAVLERLLARYPAAEAA